MPFSTHASKPASIAPLTRSATTAVSEALGANSRVNGAGIWWGYSFLLNEEGACDGSSDRAAWQSTTVGLAFSP